MQMGVCGTPLLKLRKLQELQNFARPLPKIDGEVLKCFNSFLGYPNIDKGHQQSCVDWNG